MKIGNTEMPSRAYVGRFTLKGLIRVNALVNSPAVSAVSASGEAAASWRQHAAARRTANDLDIETLRALENALLEFPAARWLSRTTVGSSTVSPRTSGLPG